MNRAKQVLDTTIHNKVYRVAQKYMSGIGCTYCPPNKGCNRPYGRPWKVKSWKRYRKTQYKVKQV